MSDETAENTPQSARPRPQGQPQQAPQQAAQQASGQQPRPAAKKPKRGKAPASADNSDLDNLGKVIIRNEFYRDGYRTLLRLAVMEAFVILGMIAAMFFVIQVHQPENRYFATTEDGRLIPMTGLDQPNLSNPALLSWAAQAATEVMNFGFHDYRPRLQSASRNFTSRGWESFTGALQQSRYIDIVEANRQVITAAPQGAPIIEREGMVQGRYQWSVQIPMVLSFQAGTNTRSDSVLVTLTIVRVRRLESPSGVGIERWIQVSR